MSELVNKSEVLDIWNNYWITDMTNLDAENQLRNLATVELNSAPQLNENQQIVLEWLKEEQTKNPELSIFGTLSVLFDESENRFMNLDVIDALNDLSNSQQSGVFQAFSQWALEQEEE